LSRKFTPQGIVFPQSTDAAIFYDLVPVYHLICKPGDLQKKTRLTGAVQVFHVRHWGRKSLDTGQLRELMGDPTT
jgi:hypothetical protein